MKVVLAGGGTAGHVNPAIAIAEALEASDEAVFFGTVSGAEAHSVPAHGFHLDTIAVRGFDRSKPWSLFSTGWVAAGAVARARALIKQHRPDVVVGMGGYVSLPVCMAAKITRTPVVLHEQNIVFGLANRVAKPLASAIAVSFEETLQDAGAKGVHTGNPVLARLAGLDATAARTAALQRFDLDSERRTLLVFGGSQGARTVNDAAAGLSDEWAARSDLQVLHVTGRGSFDAIRERVEASAKGALIYRAVPYVDEMGEAYAVADIALCRGGATTVAELCVTGTPSVIVPYPYHRDKQQERHGRVLETAGAAVVLDDAATSSAAVARIVDPLLREGSNLAEMAASAGRLGRPDAAAHVVRVMRGALV